VPVHAKNFKSQNRRFLGGLEPYDYLKIFKMYFFSMKFDFIWRCGSIITCYVQKHEIEIIEVKVWGPRVTCLKIKVFKMHPIMDEVGTNVSHSLRNTILIAFFTSKRYKVHLVQNETTRILVRKYGHSTLWYCMSSLCRLYVVSMSSLCCLYVVSISVCFIPVVS